MHMQLPYHHQLTEEPEPGAFFTVKGVLEAGDTVVLNFSSDRENQEIGLHISIRYNDNVVALNTFQNGEWQEEERHKHKLKEGDKLDVRVHAGRDKYEIYMSGKHLANFDYRLPLGSVKYLYVDGTLTLRRVLVTSKELGMPFEQNLHGHDSILVTGLTEKDQFHINMRDAANNILLHFNPRFSDKTIIRNSFRDGQWEEEEREGGLGGIEKQSIFDIIIIDLPNKFDIIINDEPYASFGKRWHSPVTSMEIGGDLEKLFNVQHIHM